MNKCRSLHGFRRPPQLSSSAETLRTSATSAFTDHKHYSCIRTRAFHSGKHVIPIVAPTRPPKQSTKVHSDRGIVQICYSASVRPSLSPVCSVAAPVAAGAGASASADCCCCCSCCCCCWSCILPASPAPPASPVLAGAGAWVSAVAVINLIYMKIRQRGETNDK